MSGISWMVPTLATVVALAVIALVLVIRTWPARPDLSPEEMADLASTPMPTLQRMAWWGFAIGVTSFGVIAFLLSTRGVMTYWEDDGFRLFVLGVFLVGLLGSVGVTNLPLVRLQSTGGLDERDRAVLARAPTAQMTLALLGLAAWLVALGQKFHDEGAVPMVYLYILFGTVVLLMMIGQSVGIILGYWFGARNAEG
ncbi:MAG: hypothetical protein OEU54_06530 [Gemmatimonadota bacterium]|nr:hypothetical protein [Gemmatimonadota bacterium]